MKSSEYMKVAGQEGLVRDMNTGAIINTTPKPKKRLAEEFKNVQDDLNTLKEEMFEIKSLLKQLIK
tara:strand:+ start:5824 stop:6021 length:198 start_codon:yes stop_codon:yes gene_type:complete